MPLLPVVATQLTTPVQRTISIFIGGRYISDVLWSSVQITDGKDARGRASLHITAPFSAYPEITDQAMLRLVDHVANAEVFRGYVTSRKPTAVPRYDGMDVEAIDIGSLLDDTYIAHEHFFFDDVKSRVSSLWARYAGSQLSGDMSNVKSIGGSLPEQDFTAVTLRQAITATVAQTWPGADWYVDMLGKLHVFVNEANPAPYAINAVVAGAGSNFPIQAHRGDIGSADSYPENTKEAWLQAAAKGADIVETDAQRSSSGTFYMLHDKTVDRTTDGTGTLNAMTDAAINALHIDGGYGYNVDRHGLSIVVPTLASTLAALTASGFGGWVYVETKDLADADHTALATFMAANWPVAKTILECHSLTGAAAYKAVNSGFLVAAQTSVTSHPELEANVDIWLALRTEVNSTADVTARLPDTVDLYIGIEDYGIYEGGWLVNAFNYGVQRYMTNNLDVALILRAAIASTAVAPENLSIEWDSGDAYANRVYVQGATPAGSGYFQDSGAIAAANGVVRTATLSAPDCSTATMASTLALMYLGRVSGALPRGSFTTGSPHDGWHAGQNLSITSPAFGLSDQVYQIARVTTSIRLPGGTPKRAYAVEFGSARAGATE
jgi:hypothetical protein